jgi:hypothetical protein
VCITGVTERRYVQQCLDAFKAYASKQHGLELDEVDPPQLIPVTDLNDPRAKGPAVAYLTAGNYSGLLKLPLRDFVAKMAERTEEKFKLHGGRCECLYGR